MGLHTRLNTWCPRTKLSISYVSAILHNFRPSLWLLLHFTRTYTCSIARSQTQQQRGAHAYARSFEFAKLKFRHFFLEPVFAQFAKFNARQNYPLYGTCMYVYVVCVCVCARVCVCVTLLHMGVQYGQIICVYTSQPRISQTFYIEGPPQEMSRIRQTDTDTLNSLQS